MLSQQRDVDLIFGRTGCGKTELARRLVKDSQRLIVIDAREFNEFDCYKAGSFDELKDYLSVSNQKGHGVFRVCYKPQPEEVGGMFQLAAVVNYDPDTDTYINQTDLVLEEAGLLGTPKENPDYWEAIQLGRHWGVRLIAIGLYPTNLDPLLRRMATHIYAFRHVQFDDVDWFKGTYGDRAKDILELEQHTFLAWNEGQVEKIKLTL